MHIYYPLEYESIKLLRYCVICMGELYDYDEGNSHECCKEDKTYDVRRNCQESEHC